jgi:hypothetical protein
MGLRSEHVLYPGDIAQARTQNGHYTLWRVPFSLSILMYPTYLGNRVCAWAYDVNSFHRSGHVKIPECTHCLSKSVVATLESRYPLALLPVHRDQRFSPPVPPCRPLSDRGDEAPEVESIDLVE